MDSCFVNVDAPLHALADAPLDTVKTNVNGVLDVLRDPSSKERQA